MTLRTMDESWLSYHTWYFVLFLVVMFMVLGCEYNLDDGRRSVLTLLTPSNCPPAPTHPTTLSLSCHLVLSPRPDVYVEVIEMAENGFFDHKVVEIITTSSGDKKKRTRMVSGYLSDPWNIMECINLIIFVFQGGYEIFLQILILRHQWSCKSSPLLIGGSVR